jgi:hypothetical protein
LRTLLHWTQLSVSSWLFTVVFSGDTGCPTYDASSLRVPVCSSACIKIFILFLIINNISFPFFHSSHCCYEIWLSTQQHFYCTSIECFTCGNTGWCVTMDFSGVFCMWQTNWSVAVTLICNRNKALVKLRGAEVDCILHECSHASANWKYAQGFLT